MLHLFQVIQCLVVFFLKMMMKIFNCILKMKRSIIFCQIINKYKMGYFVRSINTLVRLDVALKEIHGSL